MECGKEDEIFLIFLFTFFIKEKSKSPSGLAPPKRLREGDARGLKKR
jgi:hypothetical protein